MLVAGTISGYNAELLFTTAKNFCNTGHRFDNFIFLNFPQERATQKAIKHFGLNLQ
jgi:hypothetical protein